jgi:hypothetical protein
MQPEPWRGHLNSAPVLFLSSNPNISKTEEYPDPRSWLDKDIEDYFNNYFETSELRSVRHWSALGDLAELFMKRKVKPGVDYVISEVVHCKSKQELGVNNAFKACVPKYLSRLLACSGAKLTVCMGKHAEKAVIQQFGIGKLGTRCKENERIFGPKDVGGKRRYFYFMPHPSPRNREPHKMPTSEEMAEISKILGTTNSMSP